jgi:thymidylate synthase (FAD)
MSYSQESTRYCNYSKDKFSNEITVIQPPRLSDAQYEDWRLAIVEAEKCYFCMLKDGAAPEIARSVLPICLKTEFVATANYREWRHFLKLRTSPKAHPQMREVAGLIGEILLKECEPVFIDLYTNKQEPAQ